MRPQYNRRAMRATAALCAAPLAAGAYGAVASASTPHRAGDRTAPPTPTAHAASVAEPADPADGAGATHAARVTDAAGIAHTASLAHAASVVYTAAAMPRPRARRAHRRAQRLHLAARMLHRDLLVGHDVAFVGALHPAAGRDLVDVQERVGRRWVDVAATRTTAHGHFIARYWPHALGALRMRLRVAARAGHAATVLEPAVTVFHQALVSWYGPGGVTACGEALGAGTLGVANLTLPCGTPVTLRYEGRTITVPVIDRGPYVAGREFDLTYATKEALGAGDLTVVWASS